MLYSLVQDIYAYNDALLLYKYFNMIRRIINKYYIIYVYLNAIIKYYLKCYI